MVCGLLSVVLRNVTLPVRANSPSHGTVQTRRSVLRFMCRGISTVVLARRDERGLLTLARRTLTMS